MDLFDIIGPVMIGPSSSHTAGAARIGRVTLGLLGEPCVSAEVFLHGSFEKTYVGHGTDRAIAGGLLGLAVDDPSIRQSLMLAKERGLQIAFTPFRLRGAHPNTVLICATGKSGKKIMVQCASIGGGNILIDEVDGLKLGLSGENDTLIIKHHDEPGVIAAVTKYIAKSGCNIATMRDFRRIKSGEAIMALEMDSPPNQTLLKHIRQVTGVQSVTFLERRAL